MDGSIGSRLRRLREQSGAGPLVGGAARGPSGASEARESSGSSGAGGSNGASGAFVRGDPGDPGEPDTPDVAARLRGLARVRASAAPAQPRGDEAALCDRLGAAPLGPGVLRVAESIDLPLAVGAGQLAIDALTAASELLARGGGRAGWSGAVPGRHRRLIVLDTETTGLAGGTGTVPFLVGVLVLAPEGAQLQQWLLTRFEGESPLLQAVQAQCRDTDLLVTFNGASFDLPLLETRCRLRGLHPVFAGLEHLDVLGSVRRAFAGRWPDCRLQTAERRLLQITRGDDLPGAEVPARWFDWMRHGHGDGLAAVLRHNRLDLLGLAALLPILAEVQQAPARFGARLLGVLGRSGEEDALFAALCAQQGRLDDAERLELARLAKRRRDWSLAEQALLPLVARQHPLAMAQLAKLCEHQLEQPARALQLTQALQSCHPAQREACVPRVRRLQAKLAAAADTGAVA